MTFLIRLFLLLLTFSLAGCNTFSYTQKRDNTYLSAQSIPPLKIPPGLSSGAIQSYYPVSDKNYPPGAKEANLVPPGLSPI